MNVEDLQSLHGDTCQDAWEDGADGFDMRVGHEDVEGDKHARHQDVRQQVDEEAERGPQQQEVGQRVGNGGHEDGDTRRDNDDDRKEEEHGQVVRKGTEDATWLLDLPNLIEGILDIADQHEYGVEHEDKTNTQKDATLGMDEVAVDETDNHLCHLWLRLESVAKPHLDILAIAKTTGNGKDNSGNGHDGQQRGIGQRRGFLQHPLGGKETDGENKFLEDFQEEESQWRHVVLVDSPDVGFEKLDDAIYALGHGCEVLSC